MLAEAKGMLINCRILADEFVRIYKKGGHPKYYKFARKERERAVALQRLINRLEVKIGVRNERV